MLGLNEHGITRCMRLFTFNDRFLKKNEIVDAVFMCDLDRIQITSVVTYCYLSSSWLSFEFYR